GRFGRGGQQPPKRERPPTSRSTTGGELMTVLKSLRGRGAAACVAIGMLLLMASGALAASPVHLCVGEEAGSPVRSGGATGSCKAKETPVALPSSEAEQQPLLSILPHIKYEEKG